METANTTNQIYIIGLHKIKRDSPSERDFNCFFSLSPCGTAFISTRHLTARSWLRAPDAQAWAAGCAPGGFLSRVQRANAAKGRLLVRKDALLTYNLLAEVQTVVSALRSPACIPASPLLRASRCPRRPTAPPFRLRQARPVLPPPACLFSFSFCCS